MSNQTQQPSSAPAQQITDFESLDVSQTAFNKYVVSNRSSGTAHVVQLDPPECGCEDMKYTEGGSSEVCKHVLYAVYKSDDQTDTSEHVMRFLSQEARNVENAAKALEQSATELQSEVAASQGVDSYEETKQLEEDGAADQNGAAEEATHNLREAYQEVIGDMEVNAAGGWVYVQMGQDTPEEWPHPGGSETFKVLLQNPEQIKYVHDGTADWADSPHPAHADKPGEYFKNAIKPEDVDEYIDEVLQ